MATLWCQLQRRLKSPRRPNLTVRDASARHLLKLRITSGCTPATDAAAEAAAYPACGCPGACPGISGSAGIRIHISR